MKNMATPACLLATAVTATPALAQAYLPIPYGGTPTTPVSQQPPADPADTPEEIAKDSARDLKDSRFYNKPGATRAQYDAAWQRCRLIARGSRTPAGTVPMYYNPALVSPVMAGIGGGLGGALGAVIAQGQQRRDNRRSCLLIDGWRLVDLPNAETARIQAMSDADRSSFFDTIVGAREVPGKVTERTSFTLPADANLHPATPLAARGSVFLGKNVPLAVPLVLAPGEAAIVIAYRRVEPTAAGRSGTVEFARYDPAARDLVYRPRDWKKTGDKTVYGLMAGSTDRRASYEVQVLRVTPGDYVVKGMAVGKLPVTETYCFGAPAFHVAAGKVSYVGDFVPYMDAPLAIGGRLNAVAYTSHIEDARRTLAPHQPALAAALKPAALRNGATFACSGITMTRWDIAEATPTPATSNENPVS